MREELLRLLEEKYASLSHLGDRETLRNYLLEEIEEFELIGWDKLAGRERTDDNPRNILAYYLVDKAPAPVELRHYWVTEDFPDIDCLHFFTLVRTSEGVKALGEVKPGDILYDRFGNPTRVRAVNRRKTRPGEKLYRVIYEDGTEVIASENHRFFHRGIYRSVTEILNEDT